MIKIIKIKKGDVVFKCKECGICKCVMTMSAEDWTGALNDKTPPTECPWKTSYPCNWKRSRR